MSGLLRRIKRSRAADAGETPAEEQAAGASGAPTTGDTSGASRPVVARDPAGDESGEAARRDPDTPADVKSGEAAAARPAIGRDPDTPAGLEPSNESARTPSGRPGRLRRRLRYLRRARELMLRDLGGLVFEVHRSGGGDYGAHGSVILTKVERLRALDAEARTIEAALAAPRAETVVFQPGVGGTCDFCGELYGSAARFCSNCGSPTGSAVRATPAPLALPSGGRSPLVSKPAAATAAEESKRTAEAPAGDRLKPAAKASAGAALADQPGSAGLEPADKAGEAPTGELKPADEVKPADKAEPAAEAARGEAKPADKVQAAAEGPSDRAEPADKIAAAGEAPTDEAKPADEAKPTDRAKPADDAKPAGDAPRSSDRNPFSGISNGRRDEDSPPEVSPGDPLATRESRS